MFLSRIHLDTRAREVRRDLSDPYQLHSTLCRAFCESDVKCPEGEFLWRLEPEIDPEGRPLVLVQSRAIPNWGGIGVRGWLVEADPAIDLEEKLGLGSLQAGWRFRFRLRANPCVTRDGKRLGLLKLEGQEAWIARKGRLHGFAIPGSPTGDPSSPSYGGVAARVSQEQFIRSKQRSGNDIRIFSVLYDGVLLVEEPDAFRRAIRSGIGHGKAMGLGMLSVAPA